MHAPLRLNIWSGPRNISTALMYSFAQRSDTQVIDEPLYGHYLRGLPRDPFTRTTDSWECVVPEQTDDGELAEGGCFDIKSGSNLIGTDGVPYNEW